MDATTIVLPAAPAEARRPQLPLLAAIVPIIAGVVMWLVTGSIFSLAFAAIGPLMLLASFVDGIRVRRKERRRSATEVDSAWTRAEAERERLHAQEHTASWRRDPGVAEALTDPPVRGIEPASARARVVIGRGRVRNRVQTSGGDDERSREFRERAQWLDDAPITVELGGGVCLRGPELVAQSVARALVLQLCLRFGPAQLRLSGDGVAEWGLAHLPHSGRRTAAFRLALGSTDEPADAFVSIGMPGDDPHEGASTVIDCTVPSQARARTPDGTTWEVSCEALSTQQARVIGAQLSGRTDSEATVPDRLLFSELAPFEPVGRASGLSATFGRGERGDFSVDLVDDGPHAIVTGMTGTGKSELLTSWVAAIAAAHSPEEVSFVLIDFKGGTAFDPLRVLPHVVAVVTDLDAAGARRGVGSLSAELRRREAVLAAAGVRDVRECPELGRLVVMVDEFAAMLQEHPDLGQIFTDVAARGRALGMHLVLGTQRASGIIRDALAANCPLRISLRVAEPADSRFVIGTDAAASLPGGAASRGLAFVRRPSDTAAHAARICLTEASDLDAAARRWPKAVVPASPWLPPLPDRLAIPEMASATRERGGAVLGLADDPDRQSQPWVTFVAGDGLAVIGGPGSGKSTAIAMLAAQLPDAVVIPSDLEQAWDAVAELATGSHGPVLCDDLDVLLGQYPADHAQLFLNRWETIVRSGAGTVVTLSRMSGPLGRLVESLPRRALLRLSSKVEHISAGGEAGAFDRSRADGRALIDEREVQLCWAERMPEQQTSTTQPWQPTTAVTGVVTATVETTRASLVAAHPAHRVFTLEQLAEQSGAQPDGPPIDLSAPRIIIGDPEQWRARWGELQSLRSSGEMLVTTECASDLRQLVGVRDVPPFAVGHAGRAWSVRGGGRPRRVMLG